MMKSFLRTMSGATVYLCKAAGFAAIFVSASAFAASGMDHGDMQGMQHDAQPTAKQPPAKPMDHSIPSINYPMQGMDHSNMPGMDHGSMQQMEQEKKGAPKPQPKKESGMGDMQMGPMQGGKPPPDARDPDTYSDGLKHGPMRGMDMADNDRYGFLLLDQLEYLKTNSGSALRLDAQGWYGSDYNKLWLKVDGERENGRLGATRTEALWDRRFATYWSSQLGIRHDFGDGPGRNWGALGVQGLAPYWFDVEATFYAGESGRTAARFEAEYDLLLTQRLILQPDVELNFFGKNDPSRNIGSGLSNIDVALRLRYEIKRQFAPYIGVRWTRKFGNTADFARAAGEDVRDTQFVAGVRMWF